jgi:hypothetical protein
VEKARTRCRAYYGRNRDKEVRRKTEAQYVARFGLTLDQRDALLAAQCGLCLICAASIRFCGPGRGAAVDHCHATGKVRGVLCSTCNRGLGLFKESARVLRRAAVYVSKGGK